MTWRSAFLPRQRAVRRADIARDKRDAELAARLYAEVLDRWGPRFGTLVQYGNALKDSGALDAADRAYSAALAIRPDDADVHLQCGHLMKLRGNSIAAFRLYRKAAELAPESEAARSELENMRHFHAGCQTAGPTRVSHGQDLEISADTVMRRLLVEFAWRRGS